eukprot:GFUD01090201.1.p1 GENE.GFUD01090201.1~~GFUD01090201.1.p1  ORF type:complete len:278 (+),score=29.62 GFUD01090201.1:32-865(+)
MRTLQILLLLGSFLYRTKAEGSTSLPSTASPPPSCCLSKKVGDDWYELVEYENAKCKNGCIYERSESPGSRVCFASGYLEVMCGEGTGNTCPEPPVRYGDRQLSDNLVDVHDVLISLTNSKNNVKNDNLRKIWRKMKNRDDIIDVMCCAQGSFQYSSTCGNKKSCLNACSNRLGLHCGNFVANNYTWDLNRLSCFNSFCSDTALATFGPEETELEQEQVLPVTASSRGVFLPAFNLWYCPRKVRKWKKVDEYPECCFHKTVNDMFPRTCCHRWGVCP